MKELAITYFSAFASKDLARLRDLFHPEVALRDWVIDTKGRDQVLTATKCIFDRFASIRVAPLNVYADGDTVIAELEITLDAERIRVIDVIEYSPDQKIRAIRAFKS